MPGLKSQWEPRRTAEQVVAELGGSQSRTRPGMAQGTSPCACAGHRRRDGGPGGRRRQEPWQPRVQDLGPRRSQPSLTFCGDQKGS